MTQTREEKDAYHKAYRESYREKLKAYQKAYYHANREKRTANLKAWAKANPEKVVAYKKAWLRENPEKSAAYQRAWHEAYPEKAAAVQRTSKYNLTHEEYDEMLKAQGGGCAICGTPPGTKRLGVDHDHACCPREGSCGGCVRGLLCQPCNHGLGRFQDKPELLEAGADYLRKHSSSHA